MRSLLVLAVLLLAYMLVAVAPASAFATTVLDMAAPTRLCCAYVGPLDDWAAVRGTDNGVYVAPYSSPYWSSWASLSGSTPSPPGICEETGGIVFVVVRGTDNGIYYKSWSSGGGWSAGWVSPPGGGATKDTPACAYFGGFFIVVRGMTNELYWTFYDGYSWSGWKDLHGASASAPVLVSTPPLNRLDLFVQGTDNGIYHKAYTGGAWSSSWDSPGGKTSSRPAAALYTSVSGCPSSCSESDYLLLVVRGTDNNIYSNVYNPLFVGSSWGGWSSLSGATLSAPTLAYDANSCTPGTTSNCASIDALAVRGTTTAVYHKTYSGIWSSGWDSPGGSIANSPALAYVPGSSAQFLLLVEGYPSTNLYSNTVTGSTWGTWASVSGAAPSDPALTALL